MLSFSVWGTGWIDEAAEALDIATLTEGTYIPYSQENWENNSDKIRVLFFHAAWCPTCRRAQVHIMKEYSILTSDTVVLKTNFDTYNDLKTFYNVTKQHTYVIVDESGNVLRKWYGGNTERIAEEISTL